MTESEFLALWEAERAFYEAWGKHVTLSIDSSLVERIAPRSASEFVRIPPVPRLKATRSLLDKAFLRNKPYKDPYQEITDKVGVRFVVLVTDDIVTLSEIIEAHPDWTSSRDKDFEAEREEEPGVFGYQSVHYVVRAADDVACGGVMVPKGTPCEVQLRTLLQHAHSELTHDTIYKPRTTEASPRAKRYVARSMALVETVDEFFCQVMNEIEQAEAPLRTAGDNLAEKYQTVVGRAPEASQANTLILDALADKIPADLSGALDRFLDDNPYIAKQIASRASDRLLFRQPAILLVYMLAKARPTVTQELWPLTREELSPIYNDLGRSLDG